MHTVTELPLSNKKFSSLPDRAGESQHLSHQGSAWLVRCSATQSHALSQPDVSPGPALHADTRYQSVAGFVPAVAQGKNKL